GRPPASHTATLILMFISCAFAIAPATIRLASFRVRAIMISLSSVGKYRYYHLWCGAATFLRTTLLICRREISPLSLWRFPVICVALRWTTVGPASSRCPASDSVIFAAGDNVLMIVPSRLFVSHKTHRRECFE